MKKNENLVLYTLAIANAPLSISELAFRSGASYNTVKKILATDERVVKSGTHPTRYSFVKPEVLDVQVVRLQNDVPPRGWVTWIRAITPKVASLLTIDKARPSEDLVKQAIVVEALGVNLIQFARELKEHADKPEWFTLMGGNEDESD
jgi:hypothetical protein